MTIVATTETRNSQWANDPNAFGRKMLSKMGWKEGSGLGKNQQGSSTHLRAVKRSESLGIGAESDAFGDKGWQDTNAGFHGVLANLKREYSSSGIQDDEDVDEATKKKRRKEEKKRKKKIEKRRAKQQLKNSESCNSSSSGSGSDTNTNKKGIRLPQNKVQAGHARKMREAKDISNKSSADMAAIFGVKADFYKQPKKWVEGDDDKDNTPSKDEISNEKKSKKSKSRKSSKGKRKRSSCDEAAESDTSDSSRKKKRKKSKSKK